jgi:Fe2+ or Zn2+ uptake regulation protein
VPDSDSETLRPLVIDPSIASLNIPPTDPAEKKRWTRQRRVIIEALQEISGIGRTKATELLTAGCRSPAALKTSTFFRMLTPAQRLGVVFHQQIEKPVKRAEAEAVAVS